MVTMKQIPFVLAGAIFMTSLPLLTKMSQVKGKDGQFTTLYSKFSCVLLSEGGKAVFSFAALVITGKLSEIEPSVKEMLQFAVPGLIYCINNWLQFVILEYVDMTTFQLLGQLKIIFTGLLFRVMLNRRLSDFQWLAIVQLACGATVSQLVTDEDAEMKSSFTGVVLSVISGCLSALAGIYNEKIMKDKFNVTIHWQNLQLYVWGVFFCFIGDWVDHRYHGDDQNASSGGFFSGYNVWAVALVLNNICMGLSISAIMKFVDNIARVYTHTMSMLATMLIVVLWQGSWPTLQMFLAIAIVSSSAVQYNLNLDEAKLRFDQAKEEEAMAREGAQGDDEDADEDSDDGDEEEQNTDSSSTPLKKA